MKDWEFLCIEDDKEFSELLVNQIYEYMKNDECHIHITTYDNIPENLCLEQFDAYFLDVEIGEKKTLSLMEQIASLALDMPIIVITNYEHYIFNSVKYHIFDFIRKSHFQQEIEETLSQLKKHLLRLNVYVIIHYNSETYKVYIKDITYVQIKSHRIIIHLNNQKTIDIWRDFREVFSEQYHCFIRVHKSYAINIQYCTYFDKQFVHLENGEKIKVSERGYKSLMATRYP